MRLTEKGNECYYPARKPNGHLADHYDTNQKLGQLEDIEEWFSKKRFYGKALNQPNEILELEFEKIDFRQEIDLLFIHFKVLNDWATSVFYDIFDYGRMWALTREELQ